MTRPVPEDLFHQLALAVAAGRSVASWCKEYRVLRRTAYAWYKRAEFQRLVAEYRRRAEDRALGRIAKDLDKAVEKIVELIEGGWTTM